MPERLRTLAARVREFVGNRRRAPRHRVRLAAVVSLLDERVAAPPTLAGYTRDISESGLGLVLPAVRLGERYLTGEGQTLRVTLQLPDTHVRLYGQAVRYERLEGDEGDHAGYLLGLRLTEADDDDRRKLTEYLKTVGR